MKFNEINETCEFFSDKTSSIQYFFINRISDADFDFLIESGFRKFGYMFFRYNCPECRMCRSLRISVDEFSYSKSQKRILKKNVNLNFSTKPLSYHKEHYELYKRHHKFRFKRALFGEQDFIESFCLTPVNSLITEICDDDRLIGIGYVDIGEISLSSVYFFYDPDYSRFSPGIYSMLKEIELAKMLKKKYYYLGFCVKGKKFSDYKTHFKPGQIYILEDDRWVENSVENPNLDETHE